jgi:CheY-like chemotaxis protein
MTTILIAEDNPMDALLLRKLVEQWGYDAVLATDGAKALSLLRQPNGPRLAILDWMSVAGQVSVVVV